jgi:L-threonylcarbamoyladenylate synthase
MAARILPADHGTAQDEAASVLLAGGLVGLPTETVYGLAGDATNGMALAEIFAVKGRPRFNPLICHMADLAMAQRHVIFAPLAERLARSFWPGPLTLVLPIRSDSTVHELATAGLETLAVRVPTGFAARLIATLDRPLAAPSANLSGRISTTSAAHVASDIGERISLIIDAGPCRVGLESTIVRVNEGEAILLRPGGIAAEHIESETGITLTRPGGDSSSVLQAPGMMLSHYAPKARLHMNVSSVSPADVLIGFAGERPSGWKSARAVFDLSPRGDLTEAAANLFSTMKQADAAGAERIAVVPIPQVGLGEAINDRLRRAAAPRDLP